eukprot:gene26245-17344_t
MTGAGKPWIQTISWSPRAFVYHNFLSHKEAAHIIRLASRQMKRSTVVGGNNSGVVDNIRTSAGTFLMRNQDPVMAAMENRLAVWSQLPPSHQEDTQVLRYGPTNNPPGGGRLDRLPPMSWFIATPRAPEEGGETAFPQSHGSWLHPEVGEPTQGPFSDCAKGHVAYKPKVGDALMFFDKTADYMREDIMSMHTGCPVVKGVKWNAVKWIHGVPFRRELITDEYEVALKTPPKETEDPGLCINMHPQCADWAFADEYKVALKTPPKETEDPGMCINMHPQCDDWAGMGECEKNPGYMMGSNDGQGACRRACKGCKVCRPKDKACINKNRENAGYVNFEPEEFGPLKDLVLEDFAKDEHRPGAHSASQLAPTEPAWRPLSRPGAHLASLGPTQPARQRPLSRPGAHSAS